MVSRLERIGTLGLGPETCYRDPSRSTAQNALVPGFTALTSSAVLAS